MHGLDQNVEYVIHRKYRCLWQLIQIKTGIYCNILYLWLFTGRCNFIFACKHYRFRVHPSGVGKRV